MFIRPLEIWVIVLPPIGGAITRGCGQLHRVFDVGAQKVAGKITLRSFTWSFSERWPGYNLQNARPPKKVGTDRRAQAELQLQVATTEPENMTLSKLEEQPVRLEVWVRGVAHTFQLTAGEERAITIGSSANADVCLTERGILPIHCHFEREAGGVWLIPTASIGRLRCNSHPVERRQLLSRRSVVELGPLTIEVRLVGGHIASAPQQEVSRIVVAAKRPVGPFEYLAELPSEHDTTIAGNRRPQLVTKRMSVFEFETEPVRHSPAIPICTKTQRIDATTFEVIPETPLPSTPSPVAPALGTARLDSGQPFRTAVAGWPAVAAPPFDRPWVLGQRHEATVRVRATEVNEDPVFTQVHPQTIQVRRSIRPITALGLATQKHPVRVLAIALSLAFASGGAAAKIARLADGHPQGQFEHDQSAQG